MFLNVLDGVIFYSNLAIYRLTLTFNEAYLVVESRCFIVQNKSLRAFIAFQNCIWSRTLILKEYQQH